MAYDERLAERVRRALGGRSDVTEQKMFGGLTFLVRGRMCCGIVGDDLMVRLGQASHDDALSRPHTRPMDFTGRPMKGMVYVTPAGLRTDAALRKWVTECVVHANTLPAKTNGRSPAKRRRAP